MAGLLPARVIRGRLHGFLWNLAHALFPITIAVALCRILVAIIDSAR